MHLSSEHVAALETLANGIIPPDETDGGASSVNAGARLAEKVRAGINAALYAEGLQRVERIAREKYQRDAAQLRPNEIDELLALIRQDLPGFFKQLRLDVSTMYLGDPAVWQRIGFPGPSITSGGYPDFAQPQTHKVTRLKEPLMQSSTTVLPAVQSFLARPAKLFIGGEWRDATNGEWIESPDPATGKSIGKVAAGNEADVNLAVAAARSAFNGPWRKLAPYDRGRLLQKTAALIGETRR
jgi:hypothetical protein